jgi:hypothetical protein
MLTSFISFSLRKSSLVVAALLTSATVLTAVGFALAGGPVAATVKEAPRWKSDKDFLSLKDWNLKGENIAPHGVNPLYYPIVPGQPIFAGTWQAGEPVGDGRLRARHADARHFHDWRSLYVRRLPEHWTF